MNRAWNEQKLQMDAKDERLALNARRQEAPWGLALCSEKALEALLAPGAIPSSVLAGAFKAAGASRLDTALISQGGALQESERALAMRVLDVFRGPREELKKRLNHALAALWKEKDRSPERKESQPRKNEKKGFEKRKGAKTGNPRGVSGGQKGSQKAAPLVVVKKKKELEGKGL